MMLGSTFVQLCMASEVGESRARISNFSDRPKCTTTCNNLSVLYQIQKEENISQE